MHSYSTNLNEDAFIRNFFYCMVNDKYSSNYFYTNKKLNENLLKINTNFNKVLKKDDLSYFLFRFNKLPYYISKIRILKFQKWLVIYFYLYNYSKKLFLNKSNFYNLLKFQKKNNFFLLKKNSNFIFDF